jgi:ribosomal protein S18 acetylase RimI-like enzyme
VLIRRLRTEEWQPYRELRLAALTCDPLAFGSTAARESGYAEDRWREWVRRGSAGEKEATFVASTATGELVGMAGAFSEDARFHIWGMWVRPPRRGEGIGHGLLDAVLRWIDTNFPQAAVVLDVNPTQRAAVRLYVASGFRFNGVETPLGHDAPATVKQMLRTAPR